jgi:translation elongation factor EF-G
MTEFNEEEQLIILEILYTLKINELPRIIVAESMDLSDSELFKVLDKAEEILNKQAKENPI